MSSVLPKNERKQFNLRYHSSKVKFFHSFFGSIKDKKVIRNQLTCRHLILQIIFFFIFITLINIVTHINYKVVLQKLFQLISVGLNLWWPNQKNFYNVAVCHSCIIQSPLPNPSFFLKFRSSQNKVIYISPLFLQTVNLKVKR